MKLFIGDIFPDEVRFKEEEEHHILKVLRMSSGEELFITDGKGNLVRGRLLIIGKRTQIEVLNIFPQKQPEKSKLHIAIAPTKNMDRFEFFIEKAVELGISEITPLLCANSERKILNTDKIQKQIESACKQSLRTIFPVLHPLTPVKEFEQKEKSPLYIAHCYQEYEKIPFNKIISKQEKLTILIGPEGDFSKKEVEEFYSLGATGVSLGENRLRTETAGIFIAAGFYYSNLQYFPIY